ncbi:AAWKG family protein [Streptomyces sp. ISL-12]|uniref:AAWKG family protein n=1 Tax=Streptomyces sp. ISL-12 TaxID=2819177 RepID=UPI001BE5A3D1|nr:AAWKG family protein [Streptomyces sp. ISL-12]MBT2413571.1 AAWKG family protein [Streptomyces sp. ISL-12]
MADAQRNNDDNWKKAVDMLTGYVLPERSALFDHLKGNSDIPLMHVRLDHVGRAPVSGFIASGGWRTHGTDYTIPFYRNYDHHDDASSGTKLDAYRAHITFIGRSGSALPPSGDDVLQGTEKTSEYLKDKGGWNKEGGYVEWNTQPLAQYVNGSSDALWQLMLWPFSTQGYEKHGISVADGDAVDLGSFNDAAKTFDRVVKFFEDAADTVGQWEAKDIGDGSESWAGTGASIFKELIHKLAQNYKGYAEQVGGGDHGSSTMLEDNVVTSKPARALAEAQTLLYNAANDLHTAWRAWRPESSPHRWLYDMLQEARMHVLDKNITPTEFDTEGGPRHYRTIVRAAAGFQVDISIGGKSYGVIDDMETWKKIGEEAVRRWNESAQQVLGAAGAQAITKINDALHMASAAFDATVTDKDKRSLSDIATKEENNKEKADAAKEKDDAKKEKEQEKAEAAKEKAEAKADAAKEKDEAKKEKEQEKAEAAKEKAAAKAEQEKQKEEAAEEKAAAKAEQDQEKAAAKAEQEAAKEEAAKEKAAAKAEQDQEKAAAKAEQEAAKAEAKQEQEAAKSQNEQDREEAKKQAAEQSALASQQATQQRADAEKDRAAAKADQEAAKADAAKEKEAAKAEQDQEKAAAKAEQEAAKAEAKQEQEAAKSQNEQDREEAKKQAAEQSALASQQATQQRADAEKDRAAAKKEQEQQKAEAEQEKAAAKAEQEQEQAAAKQEAEAEKAAAKQEQEAAKSEAEQERAAAQQEQEAEKAAAKEEQEQQKAEAEAEKAAAKQEQEAAKSEAEAERAAAKEEQEQQKAEVEREQEQARAEQVEEQRQARLEAEQAKNEAQADYEQQKADAQAERDAAEQQADQQQAEAKQEYEQQKAEAQEDRDQAREQAEQERAEAKQEYESRLADGVSEDTAREDYDRWLAEIDAAEQDAVRQADAAEAEAKQEYEQEKQAAQETREQAREDAAQARQDARTAYDARMNEIQAAYDDTAQQNPDYEELIRQRIAALPEHDDPSAYLPAGTSAAASPYASAFTDNLYNQDDLSSALGRSQDGSAGSAGATGSPYGSTGSPGMMQPMARGADSGSTGERVRTVVEPTTARTSRAAGPAQTVEDEEHAVATRGMQTASSAPFMPPMGGAPMGGGGQQTESQGDRERTAWLPEDEDVWGTDEGGVPQALGR